VEGRILECGAGWPKTRNCSVVSCNSGRKNGEFLASERNILAYGDRYCNEYISRL